MNTPMLKRRLNPFLLASTVLVLSLLAGLAVVFQGRLSEVVSEKKNLSQTLEDRQDTIDTLRAEKNNLTSEVATLSTSLENLRSQNQELENEVGNQESTISRLEDEVDQKDDRIQDLEGNLTSARANASDILDDMMEVCDVDDDANLTDDGLDACEERFEDTP